jgi:hypothetical protein
MSAEKEDLDVRIKLAWLVKSPPSPLPPNLAVLSLLVKSLEIGVCFKSSAGFMQGGLAIYFAPWRLLDYCKVVVIYYSCVKLISLHQTRFGY